MRAHTHQSLPVIGEENAIIKQFFTILYVMVNGLPHPRSGGAGLMPSPSLSRLCVSR